MFLQLLTVMVEAASIDLKIFFRDVRPASPVVSGAADHFEKAVLDVIDISRGTLGEGNERTLTNLLTRN
jgi:hypothetical protein